MNRIISKREQAIEACDKVINGIEDNTITVSSALLLCKKIARLLNDEEAQLWLEYEYGGYPRDIKGNIINSAWQIAEKHGRSYRSKDKNGDYRRVIFTELCSELEKRIEIENKAINNYSTQGFSVSGEWALAATDRLVQGVATGTNVMLDNIQTSERHLLILKSQYYDYAAKWQIDLCFGDVVDSIFDEYKNTIEIAYSELPLSLLQKLSAIEELLEDGNAERYAQVLTSCRRLWNEVASTLFDDFFANSNIKTYKTKSGKEIDVSGDHYNNKLSAVIESLQNRAVKNSIVGSEIVYLIDWMEQIYNQQCAGVHAEVSREQARRCIIHTYIALGDLMTMKKDSAE